MPHDAATHDVLASRWPRPCFAGARGLEEGHTLLAGAADENATRMTVCPKSATTCWNQHSARNDRSMQCWSSAAPRARSGVQRVTFEGTGIQMTDQAGNARGRRTTQVDQRRKFKRTAQSRSRDLKAGRAAISCRILAPLFYA